MRKITKEELDWIFWHMDHRNVDQTSTIEAIVVWASLVLLVVGVTVFIR